MSAPNGRPKGRKPWTGVAKRRTVIIPSRREGGGGRVVQ